MPKHEVCGINQGKHFFPNYISFFKKENINTGVVMSFSLTPIHDNVIFGHVMIVSERERDKKSKNKVIDISGPFK